MVALLIIHTNQRLEALSTPGFVPVQASIR
jgi:hypothetical protein